MNLKIAAATLAASGIAGIAQATPMYFDFTGTIFDGSNTAISGGFNFETDRLLSAGEPAGGWQYTFVDWQPVGLTSPSAFLNFGGQELSFPYYENHYSLINFADQCTSAPCEPNTADNFNLMALTSDLPWSPDFTGTLHTRMIIVINSDWETLDFIDGPTAVPTDIVTLPLYNLVGIYQENVQDCVAGSCTWVSDNQFSFSLGTVSRGLGARSVPEPGTLGLLGFALGGILLRRRRPPVKPG